MNKDGKVPIYLKLSDKNEAISFSTSLYIAEKTWDSKKNKVKGSNDSIHAINENLKALESKTRLIIANLQEKSIPFGVHSIKEKLLGTGIENKTIFDAFDYYLNNVSKLENKEYSKTTYTKYLQTCNRVHEFIRFKYHRQNFYLYELTQLFMAEFEQFIKVEIGNNMTTFYKHFQRFCRVIKIAKRNGWIINNPFDGYSVKVQKKEVKYLTKEELDIIENKEFSSDRLNNIKYFFLFCCYSGLAYTEVFNLSKEHIVKENDDEYWIKMDRQKTKSSYKVPLLPKALEIIEKYANHKTKIKDKIFPIPSNAKFNEYLKEIQVICEINTPLTVHLARKTFAITILLYNKVPIPIISQLLGHKSIQVTVNAYQAIIPEMVLSEFKILREKISK